MKSMNNIISSFINEEALKRGCSNPLIGFADISDISFDNLPDPSFDKAISIAIPIDPHVVAELESGPTLNYYNEIRELSSKVESLQQAVCEMLESEGYRAVAFNRNDIGIIKHNTAKSSYELSDTHYSLTHKVIAAHAGLGWIGKNGLIITKHFGPAVLLSAILADVPVSCSTEVFLSRCARCMECINICPANALNPFKGSHEINSKDAVDVDACMEMCHKLSRENIGIEADMCGLCIYACPYTKAYLQRNGINRI